MTPLSRAARPADMPAVYEVLSLCFPDARPDLFRRQTEHDSTFRWRHGRVVEVDGAVVGYLHIFDRRMWLRGARLRAAGIGSVATHPDYRRRGLATALLRDTLVLLRREGFHLSFLGSEVAPAFYERLGWRIVRQPSHGAPAAEAARLPERPGLTIRPFAPSDLTAVARIHARATRGRTGAVARSLRYWTDHLSWIDDDAGGFLVTVSGRGGIAAFVRSRSERWASTLMVLDAHCRQGAEAHLAPLLGTLGRYAVGQGLKGIQASLPEGHPLADAFARLPSAGMTTEVRFPLMMRVVDLPDLLRRLAPLLGERLPAMNAPAVCLAFEEDGERTYLCIARDGVQVAQRPAGEVASVAPGEAVTLLMGQKTVREVLAPTADPPSEGALSALEQLLPREPLHFWGADRI
jgi:ribosomal protein S18 acetylase RimI-like enzyme